MKWTERNFSGIVLNSVMTQLLNVHYSLKKVQGKKKRDDAKVDAAATEVDEKTFEQLDSEQSTNLLSTKDEDVIF